MDSLQFYIGCAIYIGAVLIAPTRVGTVLFFGSPDDPETWYQKMGLAIPLFPLLAFIFWGIGWVLMWAGRIATSPVVYLWSLFP